MCVYCTCSVFDCQFCTAPAAGSGTDCYNCYKIVKPVAKEFFEKPGMLEAVLPSGMYMAETDRPLFYSPGCEPVSFRARHIVFGTFSAQEATNEN